MYLEKEKFVGHNAETFTLKHIIDFVKVLEESGVPESGIDLEVEGGSCCDVCGEYFYGMREMYESVGYDSEKGFFIIDKENSDEKYSFFVLQCSSCGHWYTNIERIK